ncbi:MAG: GNAT family N-acetyltransferase, partial [Solirubrobacterales bacterium]
GPWEPERSHGVYDGTRMLGCGGILTREITVPGPAKVPAAAVTFVGVLPDARRRGVLSTLMRAQLDGLHETTAEPVAVLWASQPTIYGRFGYGVASRHAVIRVPAQAAFHSGCAWDGQVELLGADAAAAPMRSVHAALAEHRVGWLSRPESSWRSWLADIPSARGKASAFRYLVHNGADGPGGYAVLRFAPAEQPMGPDQRINVQEIMATGLPATVGLWRAMLDLDLVVDVDYWNLALDDPLLLVLEQPRGVITAIGDGLWVRLVDLDRALVARGYAAPCSVVLEVSDAFCPWNGGRWRLDVDGTGVATVERTTAAADLRCDVAALGAAYLGGTRLSTLAGAGRVQELRPNALVNASRAFAGDAEPYCPEVF